MPISVTLVKILSSIFTLAGENISLLGMCECLVVAIDFLSDIKNRLFRLANSIASGSINFIPF